MVDAANVDWDRYIGSLPADEMRALHSWLLAEELSVGEFADILERASSAQECWREQPGRFIAQIGYARARAYAWRKRRFTTLIVALEDALVCGALPGDVTPAELQR
jgi:hypothetical protein